MRRSLARFGFTLAEGTKLLSKMKFGFTLAEILITIGVIGVVAAMTIPNLIQKNFERQVVSKLTETQSIITQALRMSEDEYGDFEIWENGVNGEVYIKNIASKILPFLKVAVDCSTYDEKGNCVPVSSYTALSNSLDTNRPRTDREIYKFVLNNGSAIWIRCLGIGLSTLWFYIDINGKYMPNTIGKDLFLFEYRNNSLYPAGAPGSLYDYRTHCKSDKSGWGCAYYVLHNGNMNYLH